MSHPVRWTQLCRRWHSQAGLWSRVAKHLRTHDCHQWNAKISDRELDENFWGTSSKSENLKCSDPSNLVRNQLTFHYAKLIYPLMHLNIPSHYGASTWRQNWSGHIHPEHFFFHREKLYEVKHHLLDWRIPTFYFEHPSWLHFRANYSHSLNFVDILDDRSAHINACGDTSR